MESSSGGLGGEDGKGWPARIRVYVPDFHFEYDSHVIFTELGAQIMVLGQRDFLREFDVLFKGNEAQFFVQKTKKS